MTGDDNMNNEKVGAFLAELRQEKNLKQTDIAKLCNVTFQAVSQWETGKTLPDIEILRNLSNLYNITINEILEGSRNIPEEVAQFEENYELSNEDKSKIKSKILVSIIMGIITFILLIAGLVGRSLQLMLVPALVITIYHSISYYMNKDNLTVYIEQNKSNIVLYIISIIFLFISLLIFIIGVLNGSLLIYGFLQPFVYGILILNFNSLKKLFEKT